MVWSLGRKMPDLLSFLIQNCLHDPKGDAKIDISSKELEKNFELTQVTYLKAQGLLEPAPAPAFLRCSDCGCSCTIEVIRDSGRHFLFCEDYSSRRELEPKEIERWRLSLLGLGRFIADNLRSTFVNRPIDNGLEVCIQGGYEYFLEKEEANWLLKIESVKIILSEVFTWKNQRYQLNSNKLKQALEGLTPYRPPKIKWTNAKLQELVDRKTQIVLSGERAFFKVLATEYGCSKQALQKQLKKAENLGLQPRKANPLKI